MVTALRGFRLEGLEEDIVRCACWLREKERCGDVKWRVVGSDVTEMKSIEVKTNDKRVSRPRKHNEN